MAEVFATPFYQTESDSEKAASLLMVSQVHKVFGNKDSSTKALAGISFQVMPKEFVAVMGPSGSGKSTLLNCISTIDKVTSGNIIVAGRNITALRGNGLTEFRRNDLGFIFQDSNLLETLTAFENIALALTIKGTPTSQVTPRVHEIARHLGIEDTLDRMPQQLSGGQRQRVAAARAIVAHPKLVLADEPTGALDSHNANRLLEMLSQINKTLGTTIMMVTHDSFAASFAERVLFMKDGKLHTELRRGDLSRSDFFTRIMEVVTLLSGELNDAC